ncbi:zinc finger BED domain-containing protein RICESLEEPER 2-like protein, partial [Tanacetum coccineum]
AKEYCSDTRIHGTSTMRGHLKICNKFPGNMLDGQTQLSIQKGDGDDRKMIAWKFNHQSIRRDCMKLYLEEKKKVGVLLRGNVGRICLTTDTWTSLQRINYMCLTAHYIDNDWVLRKKVLNFCPISSHRGVDIGKAVEMCLLKWGIESNVFTITVDNATANDVAVAYLKNKFANWEKSVLEGKWLHVRCTAHVMNLIVQDGLSHIGKSVDCVRAAVKYIRQSPQRLVKFKEYAEIEKCPSKKDMTARTAIKKMILRRQVSGILNVTSNSFLDDITSIEAALNNCNSPEAFPVLSLLARDVLAISNTSYKWLHESVI